jgi:hypothetical protein
VPSEQDDMPTPGDRPRRAMLVRVASASPIPARSAIVRVIFSHCPTMADRRGRQGCPCTPSIYMPVGEPKMFVCSYVADTGRVVREGARAGSLSASGSLII